MRDLALGLCAHTHDLVYVRKDHGTMLRVERGLLTVSPFSAAGVLVVFCGVLVVFCGVLFVLSGTGC